MTETTFAPRPPAALPADLFDPDCLPKVPAAARDAYQEAGDAP